MGRGLKTPMLVILIGVLGGIAAHGLIGLFVGPVVLAVFYEMFLIWVDSGAPEKEKEPGDKSVYDPTAATGTAVKARRKPRRSKTMPAASAPSATPMSPQASYATIRETFRRFEQERPHPEGELNHVNAFTLLVAVALSAQATDAGVNKATKDLFEIADTPTKMLALGEDGLIEHIRTIGLYRNKARNVMKLSRSLAEDYGGEVPSSRAALQSLPGVGRKTANVELNMRWRHPAQAVDTHIFRVANRTGIAPGRDVDAEERANADQDHAE